jgi:beta-mannanase
MKISWFLILIFSTIFISCKEESELYENKCCQLPQGTKIAAYLGGGLNDASVISPKDFNDTSGKNHYAFAQFIDISDTNLTHLFNKDRINAWSRNIKDVNAHPILFLEPNDTVSKYFDKLSVDGNNPQKDTLKQFAEFLNKTFDNDTIFIVFGPEMNRPQKHRPWGQQGEKYKKAFRNVTNIFKSVSNNKYLMCWVPNQIWGYPWDGPIILDPKNGYSDYYPGDDVVDWVGLIFYCWKKSEVMVYNQFYTGLTGGTGWADFYHTYSHDKKPMLIAETSFWDDDISLLENTDLKAYWMNQIYNSKNLQLYLPNLKLICWFNVKKIEQDDNDLQYKTRDFRIPFQLNIYQQLIRYPYF